MSNATLTISIGRNVSEDNADTLNPLCAVVKYGELDNSSWILFGQDIIATINATPDLVTTGRATWLGVGEDTAVMAWYDVPPLTNYQLARLAIVRVSYGQDAIAVTYAHPAFI